MNGFNHGNLQAEWNHDEQTIQMASITETCSLNGITMNKPFRPPMINRSQKPQNAPAAGPPTKKRRITPDREDVKLEAIID